MLPGLYHLPFRTMRILLTAVCTLLVLFAQAQQRFGSQKPASEATKLVFAKVKAAQAANQQDLGLGLVQEGIRAQPEESQLYTLMASIYERQSKPSLAYACYKKALSIDEYDFNANYNVGVLRWSG